MKKAFFDELLSIKNSTYKLVLLFLVPVFLFFLMIVIFSKGVLEEMPIAVVDLDNSQLSREVTFAIESTKTLHVKYKLSSAKEAKALLSEGKIYAMVVIPHDLYKQTLLKMQPRITAMINTQYLLIGKMILSTLSSAVMSVSAKIEVAQHLVEEQNTKTVLQKVAPISLQINSFFNTYQNYFYFLVLALVPSIWQIIVTVATVVAFGEMVKTGKDKEYFKENTIGKIIGKMLPYTFVYSLTLIFFLCYMFGVRNWEFQGEWSVVVGAVVFTTIAYQIVGLFLLSINFDYARALSLSAVYTAPAFAFLGITFPAYSMNDFALFWRDMLPISYFMEILISQANYGSDIMLTLPWIGSIILFFLLLIPVWLLYRKRVSR
ncbi:MAG: ABC transporter permease [Epsilonproteobacteria bacterium]|nr:ABC transporter permease [Campylobacterota bacterium]